MPPAKYYTQPVIRFPKSSAESVIRCFYYTVISLRCWRKMRFEQEMVPGTGLWFNTPKDFAGADMHESRVKEFTDSILKGKLQLPESGMLAVSKFQLANMIFYKRRDEQEKWHLKFQLDNYADMDKLEADLRDVMQELSDLAIDEGQATATEDSVEFDVAFA